MGAIAASNPSPLPVREAQRRRRGGNPQRTWRGEGDHPSLGENPSIASGASPPTPSAAFAVLLDRALIHKTMIRTRKSTSTPDPTNQLVHAAPFLSSSPRPQLQAIVYLFPRKPRKLAEQRLFRRAQSSFRCLRRGSTSMRPIIQLLRIPHIGHEYL
jgi:hypothetical protein